MSTTWTTNAHVRYREPNLAPLNHSRNPAMHSAIEAFERRMTLRLYAFGVAVVVGTALLRHFWR